MFCLPSPIRIVFPVNTLQRLSVSEPVLVVTGVGIDDISTIVGSCEFSSAFGRLLAKSHGQPEGDEPE